MRTGLRERASARGARSAHALLHTGRLANAQASAPTRISTDALAPLPGTTPPVLAPGNPHRAGRAAHAGSASGRTPGGGVVVAFRVPNGVVLLSQGVGDVEAAAALVERQFLIATVLALGVAIVVGWGLAVAVSRRVGKLESASSRIAAGHFDQPIGDESPDELGRLARSFDLMQARLAQVDRARKDFIANASHELRTPLFSLAGFLELLDEEDLDAATREEFLLTMREQVTRLTKLATDLLDLSRLDSGAVEVEHEPVDLAAAARGLVREFRGLAARHGSRVVLARPPPGCRTGSATSSACSRSAGCWSTTPSATTPSGTEVRVEVGADDGHVTLTVSDDGPGIDADSHAAPVRALLARAAGQLVRAAASASPSRASWPSAWAARSPCSRRRATRVRPAAAVGLAAVRRVATADVANFSRDAKGQCRPQVACRLQLADRRRWPRRSAGWPSRCRASASCTCPPPRSAAASPRSSTR